MMYIVHNQNMKTLVTKLDYLYTDTFVFAFG